MLIYLANYVRINLPNKNFEFLTEQRYDGVLFFLVDVFFGNCDKLYLVENVKAFSRLLSGGDNVGSSLVLDLFYCIIFEFLIESNQKTSLK